MKSSLLAFVSALTGISAHTIFQEVYVNGVDQGRYNAIRYPDYNGPITDVTSNDIICNGGINPYHTPLSTAVITAAAGSTITTQWFYTLYNGTNSPEVIDSSHKGPVITYLAKVDDPLQTTVTGLKWFKIYEAGLEPTSQVWAVDTLIANHGKVSFTIPSCIAAGNYLMRHELIALHGASSYPGAQFYMECAQLKITGGGSTSPATVSFPGAYKGTDPGITVNIYYPVLTNYTIPGPSVFKC